MSTITTLRKPKFQIGDRVCLIDAKTPGHFIISGITASNKGYYYIHDAVGVGWMKESNLEFYLTPDEKVACEEIEHILHQIESLAEEMGDKAIDLDDKMDGVPRQIQEEMDRVARMVSRRFRS